MPRPCACGCGLPVDLIGEYVEGHDSLSDEERKEMKINIKKDKANWFPQT